jgi:hypothetical protein
MSRQVASMNKIIKRMNLRELDPLRPMVDEYLMKRDRVPERHVTEPINMAPADRRSGCLSPSSLCGCERQAVMKFAQVRGKRKIDPDLQLIFETGDWTHHKWQAIFADMEKVLGRGKFRCRGIEQHVYIPELYIAGTLDAELWIKPDPEQSGYRVVIDIKSINKRGFEWVMHQDAPIDHHVKQIITYMKARNIKTGILWYENKDNQQLKGFVVRYEDDAWKTVTAWSRSVISALNNESLPPIPESCNRGSYDFENCQYTHLCYGKFTVEQLLDMTYKNFPGVQTRWEEGDWDA